VRVTIRHRWTSVSGDVFKHFYLLFITWPGCCCCSPWRGTLADAVQSLQTVPRGSADSLDRPRVRDVFRSSKLADDRALFISLFGALPGAAADVNEIRLLGCQRSYIGLAAERASHIFEPI
jgi:hypothetical protein